MRIMLNEINGAKNTFLGSSPILEITENAEMEGISNTIIQQSMWIRMTEILNSFRNMASKFRINQKFKQKMRGNLPRMR
jgi:hypothetical protein